MLAGADVVNFNHYVDINITRFHSFGEILRKLFPELSGFGFQQVIIRLLKGAGIR